MYSKRWRAQQLVTLLSINDKNLLQDFIKAYELDLNALKLNHKGHRALHATSRSGSWSLCKVLLSAGAKPSVLDRKGNSATYYALRSMLKRDYLGAAWLSSVYREVIQPMICLMDGAMHIPNKKGKTTAQLLYKLGKYIDEPLPKDDSQEASDEEWADRLANELEDEFEQDWGRYEEDFWAPRGERESYDEWASRMLHEHKARKRSRTRNETRGTHAQASGEKGGKVPKWTGKDQEAFRQREKREAEERQKKLQEMRLARWNAEYNSKCQQLFTKESAALITLQDLPFMAGQNDQDMLAAILLKMPLGDQAARKKCLREQQVRWHPDKFLQLCGSRIAEAHRDAVLQKVTAISQALNAQKHL